MHGPTVLQTTVAPSSSADERGDRVVDLHDLVVGRADARDVREHLLDLLAVPSGGDERDVVLAQELDDQAGGEAARAVHDDRSAVAHCPSSPSRRMAFCFRIKGRTSGLMSRVSKSASQRSGVMNG